MSLSLIKERVWSWEWLLTGKDRNQLAQATLQAEKEQQITQQFLARLQDIDTDTIVDELRRMTDD